MFYADRRGRILAADRLSAANLDTGLRLSGAAFLVVMDEALLRAAASVHRDRSIGSRDFLAAIAGFEVATAGEGFRILRCRRR